MNLDEICQIINGKMVNKKMIKINHIKTDSRLVEKGDLFIAINNGHKYINDVIDKCYVVSEINSTSDKVIMVDSTIEALGKLANYFRKLYDIPLIAITGSTGKTTTKDLIYEVLSEKYKVLKNENNLNNNIGLPLTLLKLNNTYDLIVTELGMNHFNEIATLSKICEPNYSIITNIGSAHIGNLGSKKNILKAKLEITTGMKDGLLILNNDDKYLKKVKLNHLKISIKELKHIKYYIDKTTFIYKKQLFTFNMPGKHLLIDVLIAIKIGELFKVSNISQSIANFKSLEGRLNIIHNKYTIIDDCYNSSYEALKGSLNIIKKDNRFKIIVLADMLELGIYSLKYHLKIDKLLKKIKNKEVLLLGNDTKYITGKHFENTTTLIDYLKNIIKNDSLVLVKGSNKFNLKEVVTALKSK
ncbi:MAG: UDP-N-acetylmuramoyl-tripeptide--D-alanyl-D-alanine ligase [Bacilli bacterium]